MAQNKCPECPKCLPGWLAAFGDLMSLLLCFFVLLLSMATMDAVKVREAVGSFKGSLGILEGSEVMMNDVHLAIPTQTPVQDDSDVGDALSQFKDPVKDISEIIELLSEDQASLEEAENGFLIRLPATVLFRPGEVKINNEDGKLFLKRISMVVRELKNELKLQVRGFTDDRAPLDQTSFNDNWELSFHRALSVLKELTNDGVSPSRISASGFGKYNPIATNATKEGRSKNRRVEIYFYSQESKERSSKRDILDEIKNSDKTLLDSKSDKTKSDDRSGKKDILDTVKLKPTDINSSIVK
jgi:chemotaxis protein MotB